jgi:hypothetical protein
MMKWNNVRADKVQVAVANIFELSNTLDWNTSEFYIACRMIAHFLEKQYGCVWIDEEKFLEQLSGFEANN